MLGGVIGLRGAGTGSAAGAAEAPGAAGLCGAPAGMLPRGMG